MPSNRHYMERAANFRRENQMLPIARKWLANMGLLVKEEFSTPWGFCDLVGVSFRARSVKARLQLGQRRSIGSPTRVAVLDCIPDVSTGMSVSLQDLEHEFLPLVSCEQVHKHVDYLLRSKFVRLFNGKYQKLNGWLPLHKRIVSVELKLSRIEDVFHQALAHLSFASESYVGLPFHVATRVATRPIARRFEGAGIGIVGLSKSATRVILKGVPQPCPTNPVLQIHSVERFWRAYIKDSEP